MSLFDWLVAPGPTAAEVRAEIWKLGVRHFGEPLKGAIRELGEAETAERIALLRACVQSLKSA